MVVGLSYSVFEAWTAELLEDDRVMKNHVLSEDVVSNELEAIQDIPESVWSLLAANIPRTSTVELRRLCSHTALVSRAHMHDNIFSECHRMPYSLLNDTLYNLSRLASVQRPADSVAQQVWDLMQKGFVALSLAEILQEAEDLPWSSLGVGQAHVGVAQAMQHRPPYHEWHGQCCTS